ncbi:RNA polymerase sigma factor [Chengkuizengella axinellae]|uniref:RNA polymerase sigma factor n=1 Tax=Chengkuizengella axinellae TaxID=3064388 RepID=A0ABT9J4Q8_9BACL|nr:RNA polymerase sigma factor [Chengkuizengella sp. 2205SS18-9]MDP5276452.1 RNA polymerase sigma factor [Chengkuizengella sp. 2205SS18-9]
MQSQFEDFIHLHVSALRVYCNKLTASKEDGEDLYQTTLEKAYRSFHEEIELNRAYLFRIAKNTWIDGFRKKTVQQMPLIDEYPSNHIHPLNIREAFEILADHLSVRQTVLLLMIDIFGFTAKETAAHIDSTEGAVKEAIKRTRLRLSRLVAETNSYEQKKMFNNSFKGMSHELMEQFIDAFRSGNIHQIYTSYKNLRDCGLDVSRVRKQADYFYFDFLDPNGHLIRISSKKNLK